MNSLRLWIGVVTIPALTGYTIAVVEQQVRSVQVEFAPAAPSNDPEPAPAGNDPATPGITVFCGNDLGPGLRAVGVRARVDNGTAKEPIAPNSRVRVLCLTENDDGETESELVAADVPVLAIDAPGVDRDTLRVVTLGLMPEVMLRVRLAGERGTLTILPESPSQPKQ